MHSQLLAWFAEGGNMAAACRRKYIIRVAERKEENKRRGSFSTVLTLKPAHAGIGMNYKGVISTTMSGGQHL